MRLLICNQSTGAFFKQGTWVGDPQQAQELASVSEACDLRKRYRLQGATLYFMLGDEPNPRVDVVVQLQHLSHPADAEA